MKLSVIMPVYNCRDYLEEAVRSVFSAGCSDIELIAIDDCSADGSREILQKLAQGDPRIKAFYNKRNLGVSAVRNLALEKAEGDYLAFCDSDDTVPEGSYEKMLNAIGCNDIVIGGFADLSDGGMERITYLHKSERSSVFKALMSVSCLWTKIIRRDFVARCGISFDEDMKIGEDVVFLSRLSTFNPTFTVIDEVIYNHLHHEQATHASLTHIYTLEAFRQHLECRRRMLRICKDSDNAECVSYVYENFSEYPDRFITFIADPEERRLAFEEYREYLKGYDWKKRKELFRCLRGIDYDDFLKVDADGYIQLKYDILPRDTVAAEFAAGRIGFKWIITFFKNWLKYKLHKK